MPRAPDGTYNLPTGVLVNSGDTILVSQHNPAMTDIATAIGNSLDRNGTGGMRAALQMGDNPIQNVAAGSNPNDVATVAQAGASSPPVGAGMDFWGPVAPAGWLLCFGQAISRSTYSALFSVIGTAYGPGDGSTTFNLPDCRGRAVIGKDDMGGVSADRMVSALNGDIIGASGGAESCILEIIHMPAHDHGGVTSSAGSHTHTTVGTAAGSNGLAEVTAAAYGGGNDQQSFNYGRGMSTQPDHNHTIISQGATMAHNNTQPSIVANKIIRTGVV